MIESGKKSVAVDEDGVVVSVKPGLYAAKAMSVYNSGSSYLYAKANSTAALAKAAVAAGEGFIPIAPMGSFHWDRLGAIENVALVCAGGESTTADVMAVSRSDNE